MVTPHKKKPIVRLKLNVPEFYAGPQKHCWTTDTMQEMDPNTASLPPGGATGPTVTHPIPKRIRVST